MRAIPGMTVVVPSDDHETRAAVRAIANHHGPCYLRLGRAAVDRVTDTIDGYHFELGKAVMARPGKDVTIVATGLMLQAALEAARTLESEGIDVRVIDMHTIKPLDTKAVLSAATQTRAIVTAEEHNIVGGLGGAVAETVAEAGIGVPVVRVGTADCFGHSGAADELLTAYGLDAVAIAAKVREALG
jgi:transketolase